MTTKPNDLALARVSELVAALGRFGDLGCRPSVDDENGRITLSVTFHAGTEGEVLRVLELYGDLRYVADVAQVRGFAERYGIAPAALEQAMTPARVTEDALVERAEHFVEWSRTQRFGDRGLRLKMEEFGNLVTDLLARVKTLEAEATRNLLQGTVKGYTAGENADSKHWRERAEAAEAERDLWRADLAEQRLGRVFAEREVAHLKNYALHKDYCDAAAWEQRRAVGQIPNYTRPDCTCGLDSSQVHSGPPGRLSLEGE